MQDTQENWERQTLIELYREYKYILRERKISLRPAVIELFDSEAHWGQWDKSIRTIRLARQLLKNHQWFHVLGILRHEMAHQLVDEENGISDKIHGEAFQKACVRLGVPAKYSSASADLSENSLDWRSEKRNEETERMLEKVRKLLALATSTNEHESLLAMNRVRELYAKYNIEHSASGNSEFVHLVISRRSKRIQLYEKKIVSILVGHFFVQVLTGNQFDVESGEYHRMIEIIGTRENVLMAEYVYHFLVQQSQNLVEKLGKISRVEKSSYRLGILAGFSEKLEIVTVETLSTALVAFKKNPNLSRYINQIYPRLKNSKYSAQSFDSSAFSAGKTVGKQITLHKPMASANTLAKLLIY